MAFPRTLIELLCALIARPSVSPGEHSAGTAHGEAAMAEYVAGLLRELGAEVSLQEVQPGRCNVIGAFHSLKKNAPVIALVPHMDTVGVGGMTVEPFRASVRDGRVYGRGACDTKGPMAAALWALAQWVCGGGPARSHVTWKFVATVDEEALSKGASALCAAKNADGSAAFRADFAVALEPTELHVVRASKGVLRVFVNTTGRACHSSTPERGVNAIYRMRPFIEACETRLAREFAANVHPLLGPASLNLGLVSGGRALNIVPDICTVGLDMRTHTTFDNTQALNLVRAAARDAAREINGLDVAIESAGDAFVVSEDNFWAKILLKNITDKQFTTAPWFSDANVFNAHGIPAVAFGPGNIAQAHTADEFIEIDSLEKGAIALGDFISATQNAVASARVET